jgi:hypothetical protein
MSMRLLLAIPAIVSLAACQVSKDEANDSMSVTYNQDVAENAAADVGNTVTDVAGAVANDVHREGEKVENKVDSAKADSDDGNVAANRN